MGFGRRPIELRAPLVRRYADGAPRRPRGHGPLRRSGEVGGVALEVGVRAGRAEVEQPVLEVSVRVDFGEQILGFGRFDAPYAPGRDF